MSVTLYVSRALCGGFYVHNGIDDMCDGVPIYMSAADGVLYPQMKPHTFNPVIGRGTYFETKDAAMSAAKSFDYAVEDDSSEN